MDNFVCGGYDIPIGILSALSYMNKGFNNNNNNNNNLVIYIFRIP
jgi:hypothetical protein